MNIRYATPVDAKGIAALHTLSWRLTYKDALNEEYLQNIVPNERESIWEQRFSEPKENQCVVVAEFKSELVGFACAYALEHEAWGSYLDNLHVSESYQGSGIGQALLLKVAQWCNQHTPDAGMYLLVNQDNLNAQKFYVRGGARNIQSSVWNAPDGSVVPTYIYAWDSVETLFKNN